MPNPNLHPKKIRDKNGKLTTVWVRGIKPIPPEAQDLIDIISMDADNPRYDRYKEMLNTKYGIDYNSIDKDKEHLSQVDPSKLKSKGDFQSFDNYIKYAREVFKRRNITQPNHIDKMVSSESVKELGLKLGFKVKVKEYSGSGNYAAHSLTDTITTPPEIDVNTLIHEIGHHFDHHYSGGYKGDAKKIEYASSPYEIAKNNEVFAENFMHYFIAPDLLKKHLPSVYNELDQRIPKQWKDELSKLTLVKQTDTPKFKSWFKGSKVVDEKGEPLVVYHGTNKKFTEFKPDHMSWESRMSQQGAGFYFADYEGSARGYGKTMPVYLSIKNPLVISAYQSSREITRDQAIKIFEAGNYDWFYETWIPAVVKSDKLSREKVEAMSRKQKVGMYVDYLMSNNGNDIDILQNIKRAYKQPDYDKMMENQIKYLGYDGVIFKVNDKLKVYVAWSPYQIKSATKNSGDFNPNDPDINKALKGGLADGITTISGLVKKHAKKGTDIKKLQATLEKNLSMGIKVEMEHTDSKSKAKEIAFDHLVESPNYYEKLAKIE